MLSSMSAKTQSQREGLWRTACDGSLQGFPAQTTGRHATIKGAVNGAKYKQIIEGHLLHSAKHLRLAQQLKQWP